MGRFLYDIDLRRERVKYSKDKIEYLDTVVHIDQHQKLQTALLKTNNLSKLLTWEL